MNDRALKDMPLSISQDIDPLTLAKLASEEQIERRRLGRPAIVSSNLLPLLRDPTSAEEAPSNLTIIPQAALGPPKGIMIGLVFVAPIWATLAVVAYYVF